MSDNDIFDGSTSFDITDLANVRGVKYSEGDLRRLIDLASDMDLLRLKDECWTQEAMSTLALVEGEQRKRLKKLTPAWRTSAFWFGLIGAVTGIGGLVVSIIALKR